MCIVFVTHEVGVDSLATYPEMGYGGHFVRLGPSNGFSPARWLLTLKLKFRPAGKRATVVWE
jgi:hypothetical protein